MNGSTKNTGYQRDAINDRSLVLRDFIYYSIATIILSFTTAIGSYGQAVPETYGNNETTIAWTEINTEHFKIVFPQSNIPIARKLSAQAEQIYEEFKSRLGTAPSRKIIIYYKNGNALVSGVKAQDIDDEYSIWSDDPLIPRFVPGEPTLRKELRQEIAYAFQQHIQYSLVGYYYHFFSRPEKTPWSDGFTSFMVVPRVTEYDVRARNEFGDDEGNFLRLAIVDSIDIMKGRSQMHYFIERFGEERFRELYSTRQSLLGFVPYFDMNSSFEHAIGQRYESFNQQWEEDVKNGPEPNGSIIKSDSGEVSKSLPPDTLIQAPSQSSADRSVSPYNAFKNIQWEKPFVIPYYINPGDFGLVAYISLIEPMRTHEFDYYGSISFADPIQKSFFFSKYINNSFRPRLELSFNRFPSASGFFGKSRKVKTTTVTALTSLWKLTGLSRGNSDWYAGLTLRHMAFDYFPESSLRLHHPDIFFNNMKTRQTDLKAVLSWRKLKDSRHTFIHPLSGKGIRFSATVSDKILNSQTRYARLSLDGYAILPAIRDHRIYLYANGVMDIGEPAGRDFLSFSDNGNYQSPGPDFMGSENPGLDRFVRGYTTILPGDRFLFGRLEYRIPFQFNTRKKLLGFIPPARTSFTMFTDAGVMGEARVAEDRVSTEYRYSLGAEIKRVFSIGESFRLTYELGIAQPMTQSFGPDPYFNVKTALPF